MAMQIRRKPVGRWDPWSEFGEFERAMNRVFGDLYPTRTDYPRVNIWTGKDDIVLTAELPGIESDDLDIEVHESTLTLRCSPKEGERELPEGQTYHRRECVHEGFSRSWRLPFEVDGDKVEAKIENGVLRLTLPQSEASKPKKVQVKAT
jgi:HSP20 family protein